MSVSTLESSSDLNIAPTIIASQALPVYTVGDNVADDRASAYETKGLALHPVKEANKNWQDLPADEFRYEIIEDVEALESIVPAWTRLAEVSVEPNVFFEPSVLIPAFRHLRASDVHIVAVSAAQRRSPEAPRVLCGLFPIELRKTYRGLPIRSAAMWRHIHCFLSSPLIRADVAQPVLRGFLEFITRGPLQVGIVDWDTVPGEGAFHAEWIEAARSMHAAWHLADVHRRALFVRRSDAEEFLSDWPRKRRQEITRLERRLSEQGTLQIRLYESGSDVEPWCDRFLNLEARGWKGAEGTAIGSIPSQRAFFCEALERAAVADQLQILSLELGGAPLAMKCNFLTHDGGFSFKIAFDEAWSKYSPGTILEKATVEHLHNSRFRGRPIRWMDSCAAPDHPMIDSLWPDRRVIQSMALAADRTAAKGALALVPLLKCGRDLLRSKHK